MTFIIQLCAGTKCYFGKFRFYRVFYTDTRHAWSEMFNLLQLTDKIEFKI